MAISFCEEKKLTRILIRSPEETEHFIQLHDKSSPISLKVMLSKSKHDISRKVLRKVRSPKLVADLVRFDDSHLVRNYKFGVLYCKEGQTTEDEWFGNGKML